jgi:hypothetical protein
MFINGIKFSVYKKIVKSLVALSYVDKEKNLDTYYDLKKDPSFPFTIESLFQYFYDNYIPYPGASFQTVCDIVEI